MVLVTLNQKIWKRMADLEVVSMERVFGKGGFALLLSFMIMIPWGR